MTLKYKVENQILRAVGCMRRVVELSRNLVFLELEFDAEWDGAAITVLFSNDFVENGKIYQQIWNNEPVPVPTEVLETGMLRIGCVGLLDGGETRITTARMERGVQILQCGGLIGVDSAGQTPELWEQILASMGQLDDLQTEDKSSLVAAINEVLQSGGSGSVDPADIAQAVEDYLSKNPVQEKDPTVPAWAKETEKPSYTAQEVGADPSGTAAGLVDAHNTAEAAHNDIRLLISGLTDRLNALADSDDTTLDQLSEVVAYIKANRELIASITTDKVSVADIINDLVTNVTNKPLSAAQGVALKAMIDAISIPEKLPNPNALTFTGAATGSYDGSKSLTVNVPSLTIDPTVTQPGQAADAAAVRDEINSLSGKMLTEDDLGAALAQAKESGEFDGHDGVTPTIGENGNWYLGDTDTGKPSRGEDGQDGTDGSDGKSAYQYAVEGGYTGTEEEFAAKLAAEMPDKLPNPNALTFTGAVEATYDGSEDVTVTIPSGGGGSEILVENETILAEGTISTGTSANTNVDTGVPLSTLKDWKYWTVDIKSSGQSNYFACMINGVRLTRMKHSSIKYQFKWVDTAKTIIRVFFASGTGYEYTSDVGVIEATKPNASRQAAFAKVSGEDTGNLIISTYDEQTVDAIWRVKGVIKYGD